MIRNGLIVVGVLALIVLSHWARSWIEPERDIEKPPPDTIVKTRTITKTDTVTKTRPVTRVVFKRDTTVEKDTIYITKPATFNPESLIGRNPLDITGRTATLTRWDIDAQRWVQDRFRFNRPKWKIDLDGSLAASRRFLDGNLTLGLARRTRLGWLRVGGGVGAVYVDELERDYIIETSLRKNIHTWR